MNEQWNNALEQVEDDFLLEAAQYRKKRHWPGVVAAAAAGLVLAVGWYFLGPVSIPQTPDDEVTGPTVATDAPDMAPPGSSAGGGFWSPPLGGNSSDGNIQEETPMTETLHFATYQQLQTACAERQRWYLHRDVMIPCLEGQPLQIRDITVFEKEMYNEPWVWYFLSHQPHITVRIPAMSTLTAGIDPDSSGAEALRQIWPDAPNLHNREKYTDSYSQIREVEIATAEGVKTALLRQEADRDRVYLTFLQRGTLVTIAAPENEMDENRLRTFDLICIDRL